MRLSPEEFVRHFPNHPVAQEIVRGPGVSKSKKNTTGPNSRGNGSHLEAIFEHQMAAYGISDYHKEHRFHPVRKWRMDFAWPDILLAVEIEGGIWNNGRHNRPHGFINDAEKYNTACTMGWKVLRFTGRDIRNGKAIDTTRQIVFEHKALNHTTQRRREK